MLQLYLQVAPEEVISREELQKDEIPTTQKGDITHQNGDIADKKGYITDHNQSEGLNDSEITTF